jgi:parallel beta-helix repeat protein
MNHRLAAGAGVTVGATLLMGGVADAANVTVDTLGDPGPPGTTSLRDAFHVINTSPPADSHITFASGLTGTINLNSRLTTFYPVTIQGPGADKLTISGQDTVRILYVEPGSPDTINVTVSGLTLAHGFAQGTQNNRLGGAIFAYNTDLTVANAVLSQNTANGDSGQSGYGGAICLCDEPGGSLTVLNSTLSGNTATAGGGAIYDDYAPLTIRNTTVSGNTAQNEGGGVSIYNGSPTTIENSTITGNRAQAADSYGGGIYNNRRPNGFTLKGVTVAGNAAAHGGGVFAIPDPGDPPMVIEDSIVAGNSASADNPDLAGPFNAAFSLIQTPGSAAVTQAIPGSVIAGLDPQLGPLASNGGPTQTMKPALSSPVIDAGAAFGLTTDQRGFGRPVNVPSRKNSVVPGADGSDMGAVEYNLPKCKKKKKHKKHFADSAKKKHKKHGCKKKKKKKKH